MIDKKIKFYQASSSEMFGEGSLKKLNEMRYEKLSWCVSSPLVFCQVEDINKPITNNSFRLNCCLCISSLH